MDWLIDDLDRIWKGILASTLILFVVIALVRLAGLRTFSKMTSFDFAVTIAMGSILGATASSSILVLQGATAATALVTLQALLAVAIRSSEKAEALLANTPLLLMDGSTVIEENLRHARMGEPELIAKLREANVSDRSQVLAVVLETTGDVSVLHSDDPAAAVEDWILDSVRRAP